MKKLVLLILVSPFLALALWNPVGGKAGQEQALRLAGLFEAVRLIEDSDGVPHVYAQNDHDVVFMTGYLHARDRFFQMDVLRRTISGTLAELLGEAALDSDIQLRTLGLRRAAEASLTAYPATLREVFEAYSEGVNAYLQEAGLPPEYAALELDSVDLWTPVDSLTVAKGFAFQLSFDLGDLDRTDTLEAFQSAGQAQGFDGSGLFADLFRHAPSDPAVSIPGFFPLGRTHRRPLETPGLPLVAEILQPGTVRLIDRYLTQIRRLPFFSAWAGDTRRAASNWWVIGPQHTENGFPLLAHDPHLALDTPAIFYEIHLNSTDPAHGPMNLNGVSLAGAPGVVLGCNDRICWGATVNPMDVTDVYEEFLVVNLLQQLPTHTLFEGRREELVTIPQAYRVNQINSGVPDDLQEADVGPLEGGLTFLVPRRNMGPIVAVELGFPVTALSVQYTGFGATREIEAFYRWIRARNLDDFKEGLQYFDLGSQNWSYADVDGNIAYFTSAEMPLREDLQNLGKVDGMPPFLVRDGTHVFQNEWLLASDPPVTQSLPYEVLPFEEMPQAVNPPNGYLINANNDPVGTTLDNDVFNEARAAGGVYYLSPGYASLRMGRLQRLIEGFLEGKSKVSMQTMKTWQSNNQLLDAELLLPHLLGAHQNLQALQNPQGGLGTDPEVTEAIQRLSAWDFSTPTGIAEGYDPGDDPAQLPQPSEEEIGHSVSATIYSVWRGQVIANTIDAALDRFGLSGRNADSERTVSSLLHLLDDFENSAGVGASGVNFFELEGTASPEEARDRLLVESLRDALDLLAGEEFAPAFSNSTNQADYRWGKLHRIVFDHPLGEPFDVPPGGGFSHLDPQLPGIARSGGFEAVDASAHSARAASLQAFMFGSGPARRFIGELDAAGIQALQILPGGQSGILGSPHYASQLGRWLTNQHHPLRLSRSQVESDQTSTLLLGPEKYRFLFPFYQADATTFAGFAASSRVDSALDLELTARDEAGSLLAFPVNPSDQTLDALQQFASLGSDIFGIPIETVQSGWLELVTPGVVPELGPPLASFTQFGSFDLSRLDGAKAVVFPGRRLIFSRAFEGDNAFEGVEAETLLSLINPNQSPIRVDLSLFAPGTVPQGSFSAAPVMEVGAEIAAGGVLFGSLSHLFGEPVSVSDGYVEARISEGRSAAGFQLIRLPGPSTVLGLNALRPGEARESYSAQFASSPNIFTKVKLINTSDTGRRVRLTTLGDVGLAGPADFDLEPGESVSIGAASPLQTSAAQGVEPAEGSLRVEADGGGIVGDVIFGDPEGGFAAALPLQRRTFTKAVFSHVANSEAFSFFTGLAFHVPGEQPATVTVEVFDLQGRLVGSRRSEIAAGERESGLLVDWIPETRDQAGGSIVVCSTRPLVAQQLFGTFGLTLLSAVPPTVIE